MRTQMPDDVVVRLKVRAANLPALIEGIPVTRVELEPTGEPDTYLLCASGFLAELSNVELVDWQPDGFSNRLTEAVRGALEVAAGENVDVQTRRVMAAIDMVLAEEDDESAS